MALQGYYQRPTIRGSKLVFLFEEDLWLRDLDSKSGTAFRLTSSPGRLNDPHLSPNGNWIAYTSLEEGQAEIYVTRVDDLIPRRLTFLGADTRCVGWSRDGSEVIFTTSSGSPFPRVLNLAKVPLNGGPVEFFDFGPSAHLSFAPKKGRVLGRHTWDPARWKRYRGGTAGQLWVDAKENGHFQALPSLGGNLTRPIWTRDRIYFGSDHLGLCHLFSCLPNGEELQQHTFHEDFYVRYPNGDGERLVYQCGGDIYLLDPSENRPSKVSIDVHTQRHRLSRHFVPANRYLESYALSPDGSRTGLVSRGQAFSFANWEGAVEKLSKPAVSRHRLLAYSHHGIIGVNDHSGEEEIVWYPKLSESHESQNAVSLTKGFDIGRVLSLGVGPDEHCLRLWLTNHRQQLYVLELSEELLKELEPHGKSGKKLASSELVGLSELSSKCSLPILVAEDKFRRIRDAAWSPDCEWLAFSRSVNHQDSQICLWNWDEKKVTPVTTAPFYDWSPDFDPEGRYLYFLSCRDFDPVKDNLFFDYSFPLSARPYVITLQKEQPDPFLPRPHALGDDPEELPSPYLEDLTEKSDSKKQKNTEDVGEEEAQPKKLRVDLEGIERRLRVFPIGEARYFGLMAAKKRVFLGRSGLSPLLGNAGREIPKSNASIETYNLKKLELKTSFSNVSGFDLSLDRSTLIYRNERDLRVVKADKMSPESSRGQSRLSGWLDLNRVKVSIQPKDEWRQMFLEAWRLMRDQFWNENMSEVDWESVLAQYTPLLERISTRRELSDLLWELQGELGTSHAYEYGGDYRAGPFYAQGKLGATFKWDGRNKGYRILEMASGDLRSEGETSPLNLLHHPLEVGDVVLEVNGHRVSKSEPCEQFLVNLASQRVELTVLRKESRRDKKKPSPERIEIFALRRESPVRYRDWVEQNRAFVRDMSGGRVGYIHIPDMGPAGLAEFHRSYYSELEREGLVVDVRYNGGGNVSGLLLEKLSRRRLGFDVQRWGVPISYPQESPAGPMVALTNEQAGSDGDIFSHCFKLMGLGPLLGKRTWGGTIGIWPRHSLVDGTVTTQPEFAFWFPDVGWGVENYGTDPDETIEIRPQDWKKKKDVQLERAIEVVLSEIEASSSLTRAQIPEKK